MNVQRINYGSDYTGGDGPVLSPRGGFGRVEATHAGRVVVDGVAGDLRGARQAASLQINKIPIGDGYIPNVSLARAADGTFSVVITETADNVQSSDTTQTLSSYPAAIIGTAGQTVSSTHPDSVTPWNGFIAALRAYHEAVKEMTGRLDEAAHEHDKPLVDKGHQWGYWGGHVTAYMVSNNTVLTLAQKREWVEASLAVLESLATNQAAINTLYAGIAPVAAPSGPVALINPATLARLTFATALVIAPNMNGYGALPGPTDLGDGAWIGRLVEPSP